MMGPVINNVKVKIFAKILYGLNEVLASNLIIVIIKNKLTMLLFLIPYILSPFGLDMSMEHVR